VELFNELSGKRELDVKDFLTFIPIYESKRRTKTLSALLKRHRKQIVGKVVMEAGAGRGIFSRLMAEIGAKEVLAVEQSEVLYEILGSTVENHPTVQCHLSDIREFDPADPVALLFHELYGPLVLDETILALRELRFEPGLILPDGGRLWAMPISEAEILAKDSQYEPLWADSLEGTLISNLVKGIPFVPKWKVFDWDVTSAQTIFEFELPEECDFLAFCGEITHQGKRVLNMWWTHNWPVIYTPVAGKRFRLRFKYAGGYTRVYFDWI
jgi:Ribosomal RNA adenine dimethylase